MSSFPLRRPSTPGLFQFFFLNDTAPTEIYTLSLHDALPISDAPRRLSRGHQGARAVPRLSRLGVSHRPADHDRWGLDARGGRLKATPRRTPRREPGAWPRTHFAAPHRVPRTG